VALAEGISDDPQGGRGSMGASEQRESEGSRGGGGRSAAAGCGIAWRRTRRMYSSVAIVGGFGGRRGRTAPAGRMPLRRAAVSRLSTKRGGGSSAGTGRRLRKGRVTWAMGPFSGTGRSGGEAIRRQRSRTNFNVASSSEVSVIMGPLEMEEPGRGVRSGSEKELRAEGARAVERTGWSVAGTGLGRGGGDVGGNEEGTSEVAAEKSGSLRSPGPDDGGTAGGGFGGD